MRVICLLGLVVGAAAVDDSVGLIQKNVDIKPLQPYSNVKAEGTIQWTSGAAGKSLSQRISNMEKVKAMTSATLWTQLPFDSKALIRTVSNAKEPENNETAELFAKVLEEGLHLYEVASNETLLVQEHLIQETQLAVTNFKQAAAKFNVTTGDEGNARVDLKKLTEKCMEAIGEAWDNFIVVPAKHVKVIKDFYTEGAGTSIPMGDKMADMTWGLGWMGAHQIMHAETLDKIAEFAETKNATKTAEDHRKDLHDIAKLLVLNKNTMLEMMEPVTGPVATPKIVTTEDVAPIMATPVGPYITKAMLKDMVNSINLVASVEIGQLKWYTQDFADGMIEVLALAGVDTSAASDRLGLGLLSVLAALAVLLQ